MAIGVNALFLLLLLNSHRRSEQEPIAPAMVWIVASLEQTRSQAQRSMPTRKAGRRKLPVEVSVTAPATASAEAASGAATESPTPTSLSSIDWYADAANAARSLARNSGQGAQDPSRDAGSRVEVRPESFWIPRMKGKTEQTSGGGTRVWTSDLCYREYNPLDPDPLTGGYRNGGRTVCKTRSMAERESEARSEAIADAVRRKRSGGQLQPAPGTSVPRVRVP
jgi:hypothetical protein